MLSNSRLGKRSVRRKSPIQQRSRATVATIMQAAAQVLQRRGYTGFTTNHVAERAGVSIGSIYQYFPDKDALLTAMVVSDIDATQVAMLQALAALRTRDPASREWSQRVVRAWYGTHAEPHQHALYVISPALPGVRAEANLAAVVTEIARQFAKRGVTESELRARTFLLMGMSLVLELVIALPEGRVRTRAEREATDALTAYVRSVAPTRVNRARRR